MCNRRSKLLFSYGWPFTAITAEVCFASPCFSQRLLCCRLCDWLIHHAESVLALLLRLQRLFYSFPLIGRPKGSSCCLDVSHALRHVTGNFNSLFPCGPSVYSVESVLTILDLLWIYSERTFASPSFTWMINLQALHTAWLSHLALIHATKKFRSTLRHVTNRGILFSLSTWLVAKKELEIDRTAWLWV